MNFVNIREFVITCLIGLSLISYPITVDYQIITIGRTSLVILGFMSLFSLKNFNPNKGFYFFTIFLFLFLLVSIISCFYNTGSLNHISFIYRWIVFYIFTIVISILIEKKQYKYALRSLILCSFILIVFSFNSGLINSYISLLSSGLGSPRSSSLMSGPNHFGALSSLLFSFVFVKKINKKSCFFLVLILSLLISILSGSKSNAIILFMLIIGSFFYYKEYRFLLFIYYPIYLIIFLFSHQNFIKNIFLGGLSNNDSYQDRLIIYSDIINNYKNKGDFVNVLIGHGPNNTESFFGNFGTAHNWVLDIYLQVGILGLIFLSLSLFLLAYWNIQIKINNFYIPILTLLILNLFNGSFGSSYIYYLVLVISLIVNKDSYKNNVKK